LAQWKKNKEIKLNNNNNNKRRKSTRIRRLVEELDKEIMHAQKYKGRKEQKKSR
jgi:hypothetical protein